MKASILIVTKNRERLLQSCLESIFASHALPGEVVIIDSSDSPASLTTSRRIPLVYRHIHNINLPQGRNLAVKIAKNDVVVFVDDDCNIFPNALLHLVNCIKKQKVDAVFGKIINGNIHSIASCVQQSYYDFWIERIIKSLSRMNLLSRGLVPGLDIAAFRRTMLLENPFREDLPYGIDEDIELGARLNQQGYKMYYSPLTRASHFGRESLFALMRRNFMTGFANEYLNIKCGIDTRKISYKVSITKKILTARQNSQKILGVYRVLFWIYFWTYPAFSRLGRFTYKFLYS